MKLPDVTSHPSDHATLGALLDLAAEARKAFPETASDGHAAVFDLLFFWRRLLPAFELAGKHHFTQTDKGGELKLWHVLRVSASLLPDVDAAVVGALHDLLEDTPCTLEACVAACHLTPVQAAALQLLTHDPQDSYDNYILALTIDTPGGAMARRIKLADLRDNLDLRRFALAVSNSGADAMAPLRERYLRALRVLAPDAAV
jgi:hypothetical protein